MYNSWYDVFPEIVMISDKELQKKVVETYEEALKTGGWQLNDIDTIPFTSLIPDTVISYRTHVRTVTRMSMKAYEEWEVYGEKFKLNNPECSIRSEDDFIFLEDEDDFADEYEDMEW